MRQQSWWPARCRGEQQTVAIPSEVLLSMASMGGSAQLQGDPALNQTDGVKAPSPHVNLGVTNSLRLSPFRWAPGLKPHIVTEHQLPNPLPLLQSTGAHDALEAHSRLFTNAHWRPSGQGRQGSE